MAAKGVEILLKKLNYPNSLKDLKGLKSLSKVQINDILLQPSLIIRASTGAAASAAASDVEEGRGDDI
jgi:hypothetical protein